VLHERINRLPAIFDGSVEMLHTHRVRRLSFEAGRPMLSVLHRLLPSPGQLLLKLEKKPALGGHSEYAFELDSGLRRDPLLALHDLADGLDRATHAPRKVFLRELPPTKLTQKPRPDLSPERHRKAVPSQHARQPPRGLARGP